MAASVIARIPEALWYNDTYFSRGYGGTYNYFDKRITTGHSVDNASYNEIIPVLIEAIREQQVTIDKQNLDRGRCGKRYDPFGARSMS